MGRDNQQVRVAIIGLGFGAEFIPIYQKHPHANMYAICQRTESKLNAHRRRLRHRHSATVTTTTCWPIRNVDFVHINSPIPDHGWMSIAALKAGKHVMCTVPMATTIEECEQIVDLVQETGLKYMMAETVVYSREFLFIKELYESGELGKIQYMQASHPQDMEGWPEYWERMIPMHYATHVVSPVLGLVNGHAEYVSCFGSGTINERWRRSRATPLPSSPATSRSRTRTSPRTSGASSSTRHASTASPSTSTAPRRALNGR